MAMSTNAPTPFPHDFLWGAATASYQIEGSPLADGAGPGIWHRFSHTPGRTNNGDTGDVACDHYRRFREDVVLMRDLGLRAYRFGIAWTRIFPEGKGRVNQAGLDFYSRLLDELHRAGIQPLVTLYHWDLPAALDDLGGWLNRDVASWFADYATTVYRAFDDRVPMWVTLNEPWVVTDGGYLHGVLAPGHRNHFEAPLATHNLMRAHGAALAAYRAIGKNQIGTVVNLEPKYPVSQSDEDLAATRRAHAYMNEQYLDPLFRGSYPDEVVKMFGEAWPKLPSSDFDAIRRPIDFLGINYYKRSVVRNDPNQVIERASHVPQPDAIRTTLDWELYPEGLTDILVWVKERYGDLPLYVTENGAAFYDPPSAIGGVVDDPLRVHYLQTHIAAVGEAIRRGVNMRGYFVWSLLDNYEWSHGYSKRFGIVHVDYATQKRTIKSSGRWYSEMIRENRIS
ncbi:MAG TPA: GH1 family beta-glucosidase [Thermoanaerobaculia bacterium]|nr:GH1 family beta-glucosidase [Thermoanaerobaculia bacterium]